MPTDDGSRSASRFAPGAVSGAGIDRLRRALPPVVVFALAVGYIGIDLFEGLDEPTRGAVSPLVHAGLVAAQAVALIFRRRAPVVVFALVVAFDAVLLATSGGELGTGALGVMIATYAVLRGRTGRGRYAVIIIGGVVTSTVSAVSMIVMASYAPLAIVAVVLARPALQYGLPAGIAEYVFAREDLVHALRERAELAERERVRDVERELTGMRTAMARELHDIAAHHLSGIIVGAQAASALVTVDPERTREMLKTVQRDARTTLADLRRTVGLLRSDEPGDGGASGEPVPVPRIEGIPRLVESAHGRGQEVTLEFGGEPRALGPLADTAGYRMVQESLANVARHAAGAPARVRVEYLATSLRITVENDAPTSGTAAGAGNAVTARPETRGYGIAGMEERAELVGASLTTGRLDSGGWRNCLDIPLDPLANNTGSTP
jgi:signal transduction histidine kinase